MRKKCGMKSCPLQGRVNVLFLDVHGGPVAHDKKMANFDGRLPPSRLAGPAGRHREHTLAQEAGDDARYHSE